jgi:hypothetical protein
MDHPSDWFDARSLGSGFRRLRFQRGNGAGLSLGLSLSRFRPRIGCVPPGAFQPGPAGKRRQHGGHGSPAAKGGKQEGDHATASRNISP